MAGKIFRDKALDKLRAPEELHDYIHVTSPRIWIILIAILVLLIGIFIWGFTGKLQATITTYAQVSNGVAVCYLSEDDFSSVTTIESVLTEENEVQTLTVSERPVQISEDFDAYLLHVLGMGTGDWAYTVTFPLALADGIYPATVYADSETPISFLFN